MHVCHASKRWEKRKKPSIITHSLRRKVKSGTATVKEKVTLTSRPNRSITHSRDRCGCVCVWLKLKPDCFTRPRNSAEAVDGTGALIHAAVLLSIHSPPFHIVIHRKSQWKQTQSRMEIGPSRTWKHMCPRRTEGWETATLRCLCLNNLSDLHLSVIIAGVRDCLLTSQIRTR